MMWEHIPQCWGEDVWLQAKDLELDPAKDVVRKFKMMRNAKLTKMFARFLVQRKPTLSLAS